MSQTFRQTAIHGAGMLADPAGGRLERLTCVVGSFESCFAPRDVLARCLRKNARLQQVHVKEVTPAPRIRRAGIRKVGARDLRVPLALLTDPTLTASMKVVCMALSFSPASKGEKLCASHLASRIGLSKETVRRALLLLSQRKLDASITSFATSRTIEPKRVARPSDFSHRASSAAMALNAEGSPDRSRSLTGPTVRIPRELLFDGSLSAEARIVFGLVQAASVFQDPSGETTYAELAHLSGRDARTVRKALRELGAAGWIEYTQENRRAPVQFRLRNPVAEARALEIERLKRRLERASFLGEALMREYLSLIVDSDEFEDNAAPGFLVNPLTDERLQFDRYYPPDVAFEFNGPQHYHPTEMYSAEEVSRQRVRDLIKRGICAEKGIKLIVVHAEDLTLEKMKRKVEGHLPLRSLVGYEDFIDHLEQVSRSYRRSARRRQRRVAARGS